MNIITFLQYANQTPCVQATVFNGGPTITSALTPNLPSPIQPIILEGLAQAQQTYREQQDRLHSAGGGSGYSNSTRDDNTTQQRNNTSRQSNNSNNNDSVKAQVRKFINHLEPGWWKGNEDNSTQVTLLEHEINMLKKLPHEARELLPRRWRGGWDEVHSRSSRTLPVAVLKELQSIVAQ